MNTIEFLKQFAKDLSFQHVSINFLQFILDNDDLTWDWTSLSCNENITMEMINGNKDLPWKWKHISHNPNLTLEILNENHKKPWDWQNVSRNENITMEMINLSLSKQWSWYHISLNPNLTIEMINCHMNKNWSWFNISKNKFTIYKSIYEKLILKKFNQTKLFEEELIKKVLHPMRVSKYINDYNYNIGTNMTFNI